MHTDGTDNEVDGNVVIWGLEQLDRAFHVAFSDTLTEWSSPEDEKAFRDL